MKLQFGPSYAFQLEAINAVVDPFEVASEYLP